MKYKVGDTVRIKSIDWYNKNKDNKGFIKCGKESFVDEMSKYCGLIATITKIFDKEYYLNIDYGWWSWTDEMIECKVEEESKPKDMGEVSDGYHTFNELYEYRMLYNAALFNEFAKQGIYGVHKSRRHSDGEYPFGDSNWFIVMAELPTGQISNHYEMKDWDLFQVPEKEKANVWDGHTPKDAAERVRMFLTPKPKYPKTYQECCKILGIDNHNIRLVITNEQGVYNERVTCYEHNLLNKFNPLWGLIICRDAYWKIAGEEMGLGKPWKPDWNDTDQYKYSIYTHGDDIKKGVLFTTNAILAFPTEEMQGIFYKNFEKLIKMCNV